MKFRKKYVATLRGSHDTAEGRVEADTRRELESLLRDRSMYGQIRRERVKMWGRTIEKGYTIFGLCCGEAGHASVSVEEAKTVYYADCDAFDNSRTGYYTTAAEAKKAFWDENHFTRDELNRVHVYTRKVTADENVIESANYLAGTGSPSPALGIEATV